MFYYEVMVSSPQFHGNEALTYASEATIAVGSVVRIPMRQKEYLGIVTKQVSKPSYKTKLIAGVLTSEPVPSALLHLLDWLYEFYPTPLGLIAQQALPSGLLLTKTPPAPLPATISQSSQPLPTLSPQQEKLVNTIKTSSKRHFLLHGDTGTGKTRVYMELAQSTLEENKSVLLITPEIGLTPQLVKSFTEHFTTEIVLLHSQQSAAERRTQWLRILYAKTPQIIIGPRSALFAPIKQLGLLIVDEAHDQALKQDKAPRYHALRVAAKLASLHKATYLTGSATPLISEYWLAEQIGTPILRMDELPIGRVIDRQTSIVNLKDSDNFTRSKHLSNELIASIETALRNNEQSLVFLNRRGTARLVHCQSCGWQALCPTCDLPLTYHGDHHIMRCHTCGFSDKPPDKCPSCSSYDIVFRNIGTKSLVTELQKLFPNANIKRFDTDNVKTERIEQHYEALANGEIDIIVGTQMITKGLDLPRLSVVGVVLADTSLYLPDYSAEEQTYQILTQVIGRVGRGHVKGTVVIQTYQPDSLAIKAIATTESWDAFYANQLAERKAFGFPPFYHFLKLTVGRKNSASAHSAAQQLADNLKNSGSRIEIVGPSPAFREKVAAQYHWQLLIKAKDRQELLNVAKALPSGWTYDLDPITLL